MRLSGRFWPRSLQGQLLLAVALALLLGQSINAFTLYRAQAERREGALVNTVAFRLYGALREDGDRPLPRRMRRPGIEALAQTFTGVREGSPPQLLPDERRLPEAEQALRTMLANQEIALSDVIVIRRDISRDPAALRRLARRIQQGMAGPEPREVIVAAAQREAGGPWAVVRVLVPPAQTRPLVGLIFQTVLIYALLVGAIALILQRLTRPLTALTRRVEHFARTRDASAPLAPEGPEDVRRLIAAHNGLEARIAALLDEKDVMLGAIGHDLKTPLSALRVRIEGVEDASERARMAATTDDIARSLDDILSLARVGRPSDPLERVDLSALAAQIVEEFEDMGEPATLAAGLRITAPVRPTWIRRALRNLISNALRYGGTARVALDQADGQVRIAVEDDGPGIPPADLARMLEPFTRGEASRNRATGGAGLGLTLAKAIAEQHGGSLTLSNRPEGGLRAEILLPVS